MLITATGLAVRLQNDMSRWLWQLDDADACRNHTAECRSSMEQGKSLSDSLLILRSLSGVERMAYLVFGTRDQ
jgi:hypothetical protein